MDLIINIINGKFRTYAEVKAHVGYCFYDVDVEEKNYLERIITPIIDEAELKRKFVIVQGNADKLNEQLEKEREVRNDE